MLVMSGYVSNLDGATFETEQLPAQWVSFLRQHVDGIVEHTKNCPWSNYFIPIENDSLQEYVMFLIYEMISGKPPSDKFLTRAQVVGMSLLLALLVYANGMDIYRWING